MRNKFSWHRYCKGTLAGIGLALFLATVLSVPAAAQEKQPLDECIAAASSSWTRQEAWVWKQLCSRRQANFNESGSFGARTDVDEPTSWSPQRVLRPSFIEAILAEARYSDRLANRSIIIRGAWFRSPINLENSSIPSALYLWQSRFDAEVNLLGADISGTIGLDGSAFYDELDLELAKVEGGVFLRRGARFQQVDLTNADIGGDVETIDATFEREVNLIGADIGGDVDAQNATFEDKLDLDGAKVQGGVLLHDEAKFQYVNLRGAQVGGNIEVTKSSTFAGELNLNSVKVDGNVFLRDGAKFQRVDLISADIGANVDATKSTFQGDLDLYTAQVEGSVWLYGSEFAKEVDCSGATIAGVLSLYRKGQPPKWQEAAAINLEGTTVRSVDDAPEAWPHHMTLAGIVIEQPHGPDAASDPAFSDRDASWYLNDWLGSDKYSREAYKQVEGLLRSVGRNRIADRVAMARLDHDYAFEWNLGAAARWVVGGLHKVTVGYGYRPEWAIFWIVLLIIAGTVVIARGLPDYPGANAKACSRVVLSCQRLIPLISFGKSYEDVDLTSETVPAWVRRYFYLHAILGYILAAFLVTALARITTT